jgi:hypothetical protein
VKSHSPAKTWAILITVFACLFILSFYAEDIGRLTAQWGPKPPPAVPVHVQSRNGLSGEVAVFTNFHTNTLSVEVTFNNATFHQTKIYDLVLQPGQTQEIGWAEGWKVVPGETVTLSSADWASITYTFN